MDNPGLYNLGDAAITTAQTGDVITAGSSAQGQAQAFIDQLDGMLAATVSFNFTYGSGGMKISAYLQTSINQGITWCDIACQTFTTQSEEKIINLSALTPKTTAIVPTDGTLTDDTCVDGVLGDRLRVKLVTTGTYAGNTSLAVRANVR